MKIKTTKIAAGDYEVTDGNRIVTITKRENIGWIAGANWDRFLMTDPLWTKREAVAEAVKMLENPRVEA